MRATGAQYVYLHTYQPLSRRSSSSSSSRFADNERRAPRNFLCLVLLRAFFDNETARREVARAVCVCVGGLRATRAVVPLFRSLR